MAYFIAIDLGATSGRTILGCLTDHSMKMEEINRFPNGPVQKGDYLHWDFKSLYEHIIEGLTIIGKRGVKVESIGVDTWGVDVAFVGEDGDFLDEPIAYRDPYTVGMPEKFFRDEMPVSELYSRTGIQIMNLNTVFQLYALHCSKSPLLQKAAKVLFVPDAITYRLTGKMVTEYTIASTSGMLDPVSKQFDSKILSAVGLDSSKFAPIVMPGTQVGLLSDDIAKKTGLGAVPVIAVAEHDTGSAVAAVPAKGQNFAYLSSGTWSLMGVELNDPIMTERARELNVTNEGGVNGTVRFLKNITGMWILEQCLKQWKAEGHSYSYPELVKMAEETAPSPAHFNPDDSSFAMPENMPAAIKAYFEARGEKAPVTHSEYVRCIFESLAARYAEVMKMFLELAPVKIEKLHIIGGGCRNELLNSFTAKALGIPVCAGPVEATAIGNFMIQAKAAGMVSSLAEIRAKIAATVEMKEF